MGAVPTLRTWSSGEIATAAMMNANVRDPVTFLLNRPYLLLSNSGNVSIPASTRTLLSFDTEFVDTDNMHSIFTNPDTITVQTPGLYDIQIAARWAATAVTDTTGRGVQVRLNAAGSATGGTLLVDGGAISTSAPPNSAGGSYQTTVETSVWAFLNTGDVVQFFAWQSTSAALATAGRVGRPALDKNSVSHELLREVVHPVSGGPLGQGSSGGTARRATGRVRSGTTRID